MTTLYQIDARMAALIENGFDIDAETGEVFFIDEDFEDLEAERAEKLEAVACFIKGLDAEAAAIKAEEKALEARRKAKEAKADRLRVYLAQSLQNAGESRYESARCAVSFRKSEAVEITEPGQVPRHLFTVKTTETADKAAIKKLLKAGEYVPGVELVTRQNIQVK